MAKLYKSIFKEANDKNDLISSANDVIKDVQYELMKILKRLDDKDALYISENYGNDLFISMILSRIYSNPNSNVKKALMKFNKDMLKYKLF